MNNFLFFRLRIHFLFWIVLAGAVLTGQFVQILVLFLIVLAHETGHLLVANAFGWEIEEVEILPFGGVARLNARGRENPEEEFWITVAGPAMNVLLMLLSLLLAFFSLWSWEWSLFFLIGNLWIALFNLLPIYPLDGGRLLQIILSLFLPLRRAILFSLFAGILLSLLILALSLWRLALGVQLWLIIPYLLFMILQEYRNLPYRFQSFLLNRYLNAGRLPPRRTAYVSVSSDATLKAATTGMYRHRYHIFRFVLRPGEKPVYFGEGRILAEIFQNGRALDSFARLVSEDGFRS